MSLKLWQGVFEDMEATWLRWVDAEGDMIPIGAERAESAEHRAESAEQHAERLAERLRALGVEPGG